MAGEQLCGRGPHGLGGQQAEQEPAVWPGSKVANKGCMDRSMARRLRHVFGVTWMCQKETESSGDNSFQSQDFHGQGECEAIGILWKAQARLLILGTHTVLKGQ